MYKEITKKAFSTLVERMENVSNLSDKEKNELLNEIAQAGKTMKEEKKNVYWRNKYNSQKERHILKESHRIVKEHGLENEITELEPFESWYEKQDKSEM